MKQSTGGPKPGYQPTHRSSTSRSRTDTIKMPTLEDFTKSAEARGLPVWDYAQALLKELFETLNDADSSGSEDECRKIYHEALSKVLPDVPEINDLPLPESSDSIEDYQ